MGKASKGRDTAALWIQLRGPMGGDEACAVRVAMVHSFYDDDTVPSGENRVVLEQSDALSRVASVLLVERRTSRLQQKRFYSLAAAARASGLASDRTVLKEIDSFRPDVVHVHNTFPNIGHTWIADVDVPVVVTLHNYRWACANGLFWRDGHPCFDCPTRGSHRAVVNRCYRASAAKTVPLAIATRKPAYHELLAGAAKVVVLNKAAAEYVQKFHSGADAQIIPNFVPRTASSDPRETENAGHRRGWAFCGRLSAEKGVTNLRAENFSRQDPLLIAGNGPEHDSVFSNARNSGGKIKYLGRLSEDGVSQLLRGVKGLIIPSLWTEGLPTVALKALAVGTPLIVSTLCSAGDELTSDGAGIRYHPLSDSELQSALDEVAHNQALFSQQAFRNFERRFSEGLWTDSIMDLYRRVTTS